MCGLSKETWEQINTAYALRIGRRDLARNMNVSACLSCGPREMDTAESSGKNYLTPELTREVIKMDAINDNREGD